MSKTSWFSVTIPKNIVIDGSKKDIYTKNYEITVKGDLSGHETIYVIPEDNFKLKDTTGLKEVTCHVSQSKNSFTIPSVGILDEKTEGTVKTSNIEAGFYSGDFNFEIYKEIISEHVFGNYVTIKEATCTEKGIKRKTCSVCGRYEDADIDAKGHTYKKVVTNPTCTTRGYTTNTCSVCGDTYIDNYINVSGHTNKSAVKENVVNATCTTAGSYDEVIYCSVCNAEVSRTKKTVAALGHNWQTATTSTNNGLKSSATCTEAAVYYQKCSRCSEKDTSKYNTVGSALGHQYESTQTVDVQATCKNSGKVSQHCVRYDKCKSKINESTVAQLSHRYGDWYATSSFDVCTQSGTMRRDCVYNCGTYEQKNQSALGHAYTVGYYYCKTCNKHFDSIPTSHTNSSGNNCTGAIYAHKVCTRNSSHTAEAAAYVVTNSKPATQACFDVKAGNYGSTYSNAGYHIHYKFDGGSDISVSDTASNVYTSGKVTITRTFDIDDNNNAVISFIVNNADTKSHTVSIAFCADIQVNGNDKAPIYSNSQGMYMVGTSNVTFQLYAFNTPGVTDMDKVWAGAYSGYASHCWESSSGYSSGDSAIAASWQNRTIPANTTLTYTCKIGLV